MKIVRTSLVLCGVAAAMAFSVESRADDTTGKHDSSMHSTDSSSTSTQSSSSSTTGATQGSTGSSQGGSVSGSSQPGMSSVPCPSGQQPCDTWGAGATGTGAGVGAQGGIGGGVDNSGAGYGTAQDYNTYPSTQQNMTSTTTTPPATTTSTTTTTQASYDPSLYADKPTTYSSRPNRPLLITGSAIFVGSYAATAIQGAISDKQADQDNNYIPLAGPWMNLADRPCGLGDCGTGEDVNQALLIGSGIAQAAGVAIALSSLFIPEERESSYSAKAKHVHHTAKADKPSVTVMPMSMGRNASGGGFGAVGRF